MIKQNVKKYKCQIPVISDDEYTAICKRASRDREPLPARKFEAEHKLKKLGDYFDECTICGYVAFKDEEENKNIRNRINKEEAIEYASN